jgi:CRP-like cAMP-binding protein
MEQNDCCDVIPRAVVESVALFSGLPAEIQERIASAFRVLYFEKNEAIIAIADQNTDVYFILSGCVRVTQISIRGRVVQYEDLGPGMLFGELNALRPLRRSGNCICLETTRVARLDGAVFHTLCTNNPILADRTMQRLVDLTRRQMNRVFELSTYSVAERTKAELLRMADSQQDNNRNGSSVLIDPAPTHADIAERIGTHREAVTKELKKLESLGLITWTRTTHVVNDIDNLVAHV